MDRCRRLLVALELNDQDATILAYAAMVSHMARSDTVVFVHVLQQLDVPADLREKYPQLTTTPPDAARKQMAESVRTAFDGYPGAQIRLEVAEGCPILQLLRWAREDGTDLVIVGRTSPPLQRGQLSERMARKSPCSVLVVPEHSRPRISRILVPVDFSARSVEALKFALGLAQLADSPRVDCVHAFRVPPQYEMTGTPYEAFAEEMRKSSLKSFSQLTASYGTGQTPLSVDVVLDRNPGHAVAEAIKGNNNDLVVMGARGRNAAAAVLLGSVTEHVIWATQVPLLVVKKKGANAAILDSMFELSRTH